MMRAAVSKGGIAIRGISRVAILMLGVLVLGSACGVSPRAPATAPSTAAPQLSVYMATARVEPGTPRSVSVSCRPGEQMLGGGFGTGDLFEYAAYIEASYPSGVATWTVTGAAPASFFELEAEVYCLPETLPLGLRVIYASTAMAVCPPDTVLLGGGFQASEPISLSHPQGNGWLSASRVYALCAAHHVLAGRVVSASFNAHSSSRGYVPDSADVNCPGGQIAVGGGFAGGDLILASQTLGQPFAGWAVAAGGDANVTIFAVCVVLQE